MSRKAFAPAEHLAAETHRQAGGRPAGTPGHLAPSRRRGVALRAVSGALLALALVLVTALTLVPGLAEAATDTVNGPTTQIVTPNGRIADPDTHDTYTSQLLGGDIYGSLTPTTTIQNEVPTKFETNGSRYAGRLWADKSVYAYGAKETTSGDVKSSAGSAWDPESNELTLSVATDGYRGSVATNDDFLHVYSVLGSSQSENVYPPSPVDLVIVFDMSGSMACAADGLAYNHPYSENPDLLGVKSVTYYIDANGRPVVNPDPKLDLSGYETKTTYGINEENRIKYSRVQATVTAINETIDALMEQNAQNRVSVVAYGASSAVLMPLHHYTPNHSDDGPTGYITIPTGPDNLGMGMQQLISNNSIVNYVTSIEGENYWIANTDAAYTLHVDARWTKVQGETVPEGENYNVEANFSNGFYGKYFNNADTTYIGCLTSTQNGIYLGFKQLADTPLTTYKDVGADGATLPRIPSLLLMTDGGANFAYRNGDPNDVTFYEGFWENNKLGGAYGVAVNNGPQIPDQYDIPDQEEKGTTKIDDVDPIGPGDNLTFTDTWINNNTDEAYVLKDGAWYIPINSYLTGVKVTEVTINDKTYTSTSENKEDKEFFENSVHVEEEGNWLEIANGGVWPSNGENINSTLTGPLYYESNGYIKVDLGEIRPADKIQKDEGEVVEANSQGSIKFTATVGSNYEAGFQSNGGILVMSGIVKGTLGPMNVFRAVGTVRLPLEPKGYNDDSKKPQLFAFGSDQRIPDNSGDEWYDYYLPGESRYTSDEKKSYSVPNAQIGPCWLLEGMFQTYPEYSTSGVLYQTDGSGDQWISSQGTPGTTLEVLMTASYMKTAAQENYQQGWEKNGADAGELADSDNAVQVYSVGVDLDDTSFWSRARLYATMNPSEYFTKNFEGVDSSKLGTGSPIPIKPWVDNKEPDGETTWYQKEQVAESEKQISAAVEAWDNWLEGNKATAAAGWNYSDGKPVDINLARINGNSQVYPAGTNDSDQGLQVSISNGDVANHIRYVDRFFDVTSGEVGGIFQQILSLITGRIFNPVQGPNAAGASDSVTYVDPIGKYMEVKNPYTSVKNLDASKKPIDNLDADIQMVHLGMKYGLVRTGEYDYGWNNDLMRNIDTGGKPDNEPFPPGWYYGTPTSGSTDGVYYGGDRAVPNVANTAWPSGESPSGDTYPNYPYETLQPASSDERFQNVTYATAEEAWAGGWVYRLDYATLQQYVSTLETDTEAGPSGMTERQKETVYTIYRFDWVKQSDPYSVGEPTRVPLTQKERAYWLLNPAYAETAASAKLKWGKTDYGYQIDEGCAVPEDPTAYGLYQISDFRVWVEDSGDYVPDETSGFQPDLGYDQALYFDIPSAAIPLQLANLTVDDSGRLLEYLTNLGGENNNFELVQWVAPNADGVVTEQTHKYQVTFTGEELGYLANTTGGLNYLVIDNEPGSADSKIEGTQYQQPIQKGETTCTISVDLKTDQSLIVTNLRSNVTWTATCTDGPVWTGDGTPGDGGITGTSIASTSVTATYLPADMGEAGDASLTLQNLVKNTTTDSEGNAVNQIIPLDQTYPFSVTFTEGTTKLPGKVYYIKSTGESGTMALSGGTTSSFILNSGDSIAFYGLPDGTKYAANAASSTSYELTWSPPTTQVPPDPTTAQNALGKGNKLQTAIYNTGEATWIPQQNYYYAQSTPCRLFYSVGVMDEVLYEGGNVNVGALDVEYIQTHTEPLKDKTTTTGNTAQSRGLYFISNWWSEDNATAEVSGNPGTTFSPSPLNRYYVFQKNLPLYAVNSALIPTTGSPPTDVILGETYESTDEIINVNGEDCTVVSNLDSLKPGGWYYILAEYFLPEANGGGRFVQMAVARQGNQFSRDEYATETTDPDKYAEFLCWYNTSDGQVQEDLSSKPNGEEGDNWVIATSKNKLRTGNMINNRRPKTPNNPTDTADDYFYPTPDFEEPSAAEESTGQGASTEYVGEPNVAAAVDDGDSGTPEFNDSINVYHGNNGKLWIPDTRLLMTKLEVTDPSDYVFDGPGNTATMSEDYKNQKPFQFANPTYYDPNNEGAHSYNYQVFVDGATGFRDAVVVRYDRWSQLWRQVLSSAKALLDNQGFLLGPDSKPVVVDKEGNIYTQNADGDWTDSSGAIVEDVTFYYVYLGPQVDGGAQGNESFPVYPPNTAGNLPQGYFTTYVEDVDKAKEADVAEEGEKYAESSNEKPAGTREYFAESVPIVPKTTVDNANDDPESQWSYDVNKKGYLTLPNFSFATIYLEQDQGLRSGVRFVSDYSMSSEYETRPLIFGYKTTGVDEGKIPTIDRETGGLDVPDGATELKGNMLYDDTSFTNVRSHPSADNPNLDVYTKYNTSDPSTNANPTVSQNQVAANTAEFTLKSGEGLVLSGLGSQAVYRVTEQSLPTEDSGDDMNLVFGRNVQYRNYVDYTSGLNYDDSTGNVNAHKAWNVLGNALVAGYYQFQNAGALATEYAPALDNASPYNYQTIGYIHNLSGTPNTSAYFNTGKDVYSMYGDTDAQEEATHFFNTKITPAAESFQLTKVISGEGDPIKWPDSGFTFEVKPGPNNPTPDPIQGENVQDGKNGVITFTIGADDDVDSNGQATKTFFTTTNGNPLTFTQPGVYTYTVHEVLPTNPEAGWTYDSTDYTITVTVTQDYDVEVENPVAYPTSYPTFQIYSGKLNAVATIESQPVTNESITFTNEFNPKSVKTYVTAQKELTGGQLSADLFTFQLEALGGVESNGETAIQASDVPMPDEAAGTTKCTFTNDATGYVKSPPIEFSKAATYYYKLSELGDEGMPVKTDKTLYLVKIEVTGDDTSGFTPTITYWNWNNEWDANPYKMPLDPQPSSQVGNGVVTFKNNQGLIVEKVVEGDALANESFDFTLTLMDESGEALTNASGTYTIYDANGTHVAESTDVSWNSGESGVIEFSLKDGQYIIVSGLPAGTKYTVSEAFNPDGNTGSSSFSQGAYQPNGTGEIAPLEGPVAPPPGELHVDSTTFTGSENVSIGTESAPANPYNYTRFVNSTEEEPPPPPPGPNTGNLSVTKKVVDGEGAPTGQSFKFKATFDPVPGTSFTGAISPNGGTETYGAGTGSVEFELKAGQTMTFSGLPAGTRYAVEELDVANWLVDLDGETGTITANSTATATATNTWSPATVSLTGTKELTGGDLEDGQFQFTVTPGADNPTPDPVGSRKVTNDANGFITFFQNATYTEAGTYTYTIAEVDGKEPGVTYDDTVYHVTVEVTEGPGGALQADLTVEPGGPIAFTNTVSGDLSLTKVVEGEGYPDDATFDFTVTLSDRTISGEYGGMTFEGGVAHVTLKSGQTVTATGLPAGVTYTVTEQSAGNWELTWDGRTGEISAGATATATATNTWSPGRAWLDGTKELVGGELRAGQFSFLVTPSAGNPQPDPVGSRTVTNGADGTIHFFDETFTAEGTYDYTITEVQGDDPDVTYDGSVWHATVTVTEDPETGEMSAEVTLSPEGPIVFTNTTHTGDLTITKVVTGEGAPTDRTFRFRVTLDPPISGTFDGVTFTDGVAELELRAGQSLTLHGLPADTTYTVEELTSSGWTVTWEGQTGTIAEGETATATATNAWSPDHVHLDADKRLVGGELAEGQFQFLLTPGPDNPQPDPIGERMAANGADGSVTLVDDAVFTVPGTYTYTVSEVQGDDPAIGYDSTVYTVTVTVTQDEATGQLTAEVTIDPSPGAGGTMTFTNVQEGDRKVEVEPGAGRPVNPGDLVTYEISYRNDSDTPGTVTIVDPVDAGLDFVSASGNGAYDPTGTLPPGTTVGYAYRGTVTWAVPDVPPGGSGTVSVTFRVNRTAAETGAIRDRALIDWDNDHEPWTPTPDVPTNPFEWPTIVPQTGDGRPLILPTVLTAAAVAALVAAAWLLLRSGRSGTPGGYARDRRTHPRRR